MHLVFPCLFLERDVRRHSAVETGLIMPLPREANLVKPALEMPVAKPRKKTVLPPASNGSGRRLGHIKSRLAPLPVERSKSSKRNAKSEDKTQWQESR